MTLSKLPDLVIQWAFYGLFFFIPLFFTPLNYELFEYNKMMLTYGFTVIIAAAWISKIILHKKFLIRRTPFDIPLLLFLASQSISFIFSMDQHVSFWGYYSRFHGGLLSTFTYLMLFYAFVNNFKKEHINRLILFTLSSGVLVSIYGVLEKFGIDKNLWVQDVQNRIFSTLGQPNWLAAYLTILLPISIYYTIKFLNKPNFPKPPNSPNLPNSPYLLFPLPILFYTTLIFTKSRSGFTAFWIVNGVFWTVLLMKNFLTKNPIKFQKSFAQSFARPITLIIPISRIFLILNSIFLILTFILGAPFGAINKLTLQGLTVNESEKSAQPASASAQPDLIQVGISESGDIRKIVWKGAVNIAKAYPFFGTGVETFAYAYYKFKPIEHNLTSEWDFLYNKAHNEYLNFAATTGFFGLFTYLLFIIWFIIWIIKEFIKPQSRQLPKSPQSLSSSKTPTKKNSSLATTNYLLLLSLLTAWTSILITNFFGFSVVTVALFFFLIPAVSLVLSPNYPDSPNYPYKKRLSIAQKTFLVIIIIITIYYLLQLFKIWYADTVFSKGNRYAKSAYQSTAYPYLKTATQINPNEPLYHNELSITSAILAKAYFEQQDATKAAEFAQESLLEGEKALKKSPQNVVFWKSRVRALIRLSQIYPEFTQQALDSILVAMELAPTDAKIAYNAGVLYGRLDNSEKAIETLELTKILKPDFRDAYYALAIFYREKGDLQKARENLEFILNRINPDDKEAKGLMEEL